MSTHIGVVLLFMVSVLVLTADAQTSADYCALSADHTMCLYKGIGPLCKPRITGGLSAADKTTILDVHNKLRNQVAMGLELRGYPGRQPPASNMLQLSWNIELATIAQRWADECTFGHDLNRNTKQFAVGQNVYISMSTKNSSLSNWTRAITPWYNEVALFSNASISPFKFSSGIGHYSQVVWAETSLVGCGFSYYRTTTNTYYNQLYVCNYGRSGNVKDGIMYIAGTACSKCPAGKKCVKNSKYPGLCV